MDQLLRELKNRLTSREQRIMRLSVIHELSQRAIARRVRLSQQAVCKTLAKIRRIAQAIKATFYLAAAI
jgi:DNA-directed RNA polymerase specialized sigma subunit